MPQRIKEYNGNKQVQKMQTAEGIAVYKFGALLGIIEHYLRLKRIIINGMHYWNSINEHY